jgi:formate dehydrogenase major subunit
MMGVSSPSDGFAAEAKLQYRIKDAVESTTICCFCSVGCGGLASVVEGKMVAFEGDPDHPVNMGGMCSKGIGQFSMGNAYNPETGELETNPNRLTKPKYRAAGSDKWEEITWEKALEEIAKKVKKLRDETFEKVNDAGVTVNRTMAIGHLGGAALDNEELGPLSKLQRALGIVYIEHQARI